eukprot:COSAG05_NODE_1_length_66591_cov_307.301581_32_plen_261_part_00
MRPLLLPLLLPPVAVSRMSAARSSQPSSMGEYMGRIIAQPYTDRSWLLRGSREQEEPPEKLKLLLSDAGVLEPGSTIAELGCGPCFLAWRWALAVGPKGKVFAIDTDSSAAADCHATMAAKGITETLLPITAPASPSGSPSPSWLGLGLNGRTLDAVLLVDTYHELARPFETLKAVVTTLRTGGLLAIVEYKDSATHILSNHRMRQLQLLKELDQFHPSELFLKFCDVRSLRYQYLCVFEAPGVAAKDGDRSRQRDIQDL